MYFLAGLSQGSDINNVAEWSQNFYGPVQKAAVYLRGTSLAWIFLLIANSAFFVQLLLMALGLGRVSSEPTLLGHGGHQSEEDQYQELTGEEVVS